MTATDALVQKSVTAGALKPVKGVGGFFAMTLDTLMAIPRSPFAWREFFIQAWFVMRVSTVPAIMLAVPFIAETNFMLNLLLQSIGAADLSGTSAAIAVVAQLGPLITALVVGGAAATAMCADLGARTIREELDALRVMGVDPIQSLVVPRVLAATVAATFLSAVVSTTGLTVAYFFSVYIQNVTPGAWAGSLTLIVGLSDVVVGVVKAALFGLAGSLIACYLGINVGGGPAGVGNAVNETVVYTFMALFVFNVVVTAVAFKVVPQ